MRMSFGVDLSSGKLGGLRGQALREEDLDMVCQKDFVNCLRYIIPNSRRNSKSGMLLREVSFTEFIEMELPSRRVIRLSGEHSCQTSRVKTRYHILRA
jgi:hypothetical protein